MEDEITEYLSTNMKKGTIVPWSVYNDQKNRKMWITHKRQGIAFWVIQNNLIYSSPLV